MSDGATAVSAGAGAGVVAWPASVGFENSTNCASHRRHQHVHGDHPPPPPDRPRLRCRVHVRDIGRRRAGLNRHARRPRSAVAPPVVGYERLDRYAGTRSRRASSWRTSARVASRWARIAASAASGSPAAMAPTIASCWSSARGARPREDGADRQEHARPGIGDGALQLGVAGGPRHRRVEGAVGAGEAGDGCGAALPAALVDARDGRRRAPPRPPRCAARPPAARRRTRSPPGGRAARRTRPGRAPRRRRPRSRRRRPRTVPPRRCSTVASTSRSMPWRAVSGVTPSWAAIARAAGRRVARRVAADARSRAAAARATSADGARRRRTASSWRPGGGAGEAERAASRRARACVVEPRVAEGAGGSGRVRPSGDVDGEPERGRPAAQRVHRLAQRAAACSPPPASPSAVTTQATGRPSTYGRSSPRQLLEVVEGVLDEARQRAVVAG